MLKNFKNMTTFGTILVLITFIIFFALSIKFFKELGFCAIHHVFFSPIYAIASGLITAFIFVVLASLSSGRFEPDLSTKKEMAIYPIDMNHTGGTFHLGVGVKKINKYKSISTYNFYIKCNGKYDLYEVNAKNFKIVCTNKVKPKIVINATHENAKMKIKLIFNEDLHSPIDEKYLTGTIYIPENSVIQAYTN